MSNAKQETIEDIVAEMRGPYYKMGRSNASLDKDMMGYMSFMANRIEAAENQSVTNCNRLGNVAKMPRVGAFAACPFCGERKRLTLVTKRMRRGEGSWPTASYVRCFNCNARGPLKVLGACLSDEAAAAAWNGEDIKEKIGGLFA